MSISLHRPWGQDLHDAEQKEHFIGICISDYIYPDILDFSFAETYVCSCIIIINKNDHLLSAYCKLTHDHMTWGRCESPKEQILFRPKWQRPTLVLPSLFNRKRIWGLEGLSNLPKFTQLSRGKALACGTWRSPGSWPLILCWLSVDRRIHCEETDYWELCPLNTFV